MPTITPYPETLVDNRGIEPRTLGCRPSVFPLAPVAHWTAERELHSRVIGFAARRLAVLAIRRIWSQRGESNSRPADYKAAALPSELHRHNLGRAEVIETSSLVWKTRAHPIYQAREKLGPATGVEPATSCLPSKRTSACASPAWGLGSDLNRQPIAYGAIALPLSYQGTKN